MLRIQCCVTNVKQQMRKNWGNIYKEGSFHKGRHHFYLEYLTPSHSSNSTKMFKFVKSSFEKPLPLIIDDVFYECSLMSIILRQFFCYVVGAQAARIENKIIIIIFFKDNPMKICFGHFVQKGDDKTKIRNTFPPHECYLWICSAQLN